MLAFSLAAVLCVCIAQAKQPSAPDAEPALLRNLKFGDLNFLHTTDTHGWHGGHLQEASYSADWGDYVDFSDRLREKLEGQGKDLIVVDTGDRIEGNGLYDSDNPKGLHTLRIFKEQHIDIICSGNHELYQKNASESELRVTVPAYHNSYIASNLNVTNPKTGKSEPLAPKYRKFTTKIQGIRITAFGFVFNFTSNANNSQIRFVDDVVKEEWFQEAIRDRDVDLFVVLAHAGAHTYELQSIYTAIRQEHWDTPIQFFAGHEHIRTYKIFDLRTVALASGRFLETIGFQSITGITGPNKTQPIVEFFRRYIDNNLYSFYHHTGLNASTFHSEKGRKVSKMIEQARKDLRLDDVYGCAPQDYWMTRVPFPSKDSIYTLLNETVLPEIVTDLERADKPRLILTNSGAIRFDIFKGPFTVDTTYIISPFTSIFGYVKDVPYGLAVQVVALLNGSARQVVIEGLEEYPNFDHLAPLEQNSKYFNVFSSDDNEDTSWNEDRPAVPATDQARFQLQPQDKTHGDYPRLTPGYTTTDDAGSNGDDTKHLPIPQFKVPNVISSLVTPGGITTSSASKPPKVVDLVYNQFLEKFIIALLNGLDGNKSGRDYSREKGIYAGGVSMTDLIESWISKNWMANCPREEEEEEEVVVVVVDQAAAAAAAAAANMNGDGGDEL